MKIITPENFFSILQERLPENPVIVEAGAFNGKDTQKMAQHWPSATIHAFEPVPEIFSELTQNTVHFTNIHRYRQALSSQNGQSTFYIAQHPKKPEKISQAGTLHKPKARLDYCPIIYPKMITVPIISLDEWAQRNAIKKIDFIWLDTQGHELNILRGSESLLSTVHLVYLEVNFIEAYENQPTYQEIDNWMHKHGFYPIAQDFTDDRRWFFGNILYHNKKFQSELK